MGENLFQLQLCYKRLNSFFNFRPIFLLWSLQFTLLFLGLWSILAMFILFILWDCCWVTSQLARPIYSGCYGKPFCLKILLWHVFDRCCVLVSEKVFPKHQGHTLCIFIFIVCEKCFICKIERESLEKDIFRSVYSTSELGGPGAQFDWLTC